MRCIALVVAVALPVHQPTEVLQATVGADGAVAGVAAPVAVAAPATNATRVEDTLDIGTARQVSLVEMASPREEARSAEKEAGQRLYKSATFSWDSEGFQKDYNDEFVAFDDPRTGLLNALKCMLPRGMYTELTECMVTELLKHKHAEQALADKAEAYRELDKVAERGGCAAYSALDSCVKGDFTAYKAKLNANAKEFVKNSANYDHGLIGDLIDEKSDHDKASMFFHHLLDVHQHTTRHTPLHYAKWEHVLSFFHADKHEGGPGKHSMNAFELVTVQAQMNAVMTLLGPDGPDGALGALGQMKMDKNLPHGGKAPGSSAAAAALALLLL